MTSPTAVQPIQEARVPFNRPFVTGNEFTYIREVIDSLALSGGGLFSQRSENLLADALAVESVLLTTSCTHALEMAALLLDILPGDEVVVPSFAFVSTVNAFVLRGAKPVFVDIRPDTLNMDERLLEDKITSRTRAIVPVHYAGVACEMDPILEAAGRHGLEVVEDNAHGLFGSYKGRTLGSIGRLATLSFHDTKNFTCGEGGALLINDPSLRARAEVIREKGTDRAKFFRGEVDKYSWVGLGSSYVPSEISAAYLFAQLEQRELVQRQRSSVWDYYRTHLAEWGRQRGVTLPTVPEHCGQAFHMFYLLMPDAESRTTFIKHLADDRISSLFHYVPLHQSVMGAAFGYQTGDCPVTEDVSKRLVRLPFYTGLTSDAQARIVEAVRRF